MNTSLLLTMNGWAGMNPLLDNLMIFCARYLIYIAFLAAAICVAMLIYKKQWRTVIYLAASLIVSFILLKLASHLFFELRPFQTHHLTQLVAHATGSSFPSDHTTATAALGLGLVFFTRFKKIGFSILAAAVLIGFARVFVGIHYPYDILGGLATALIGNLVIFGVYTLRHPKQNHAE